VIRLMLVDDHASSREPMAFMLEQEPDLAVVSQVGSIAEARDALQDESLLPDVAIIDLGLPDGAGEELIPVFRAASANTGILVLTYFSDPARLAPAIQAGASGILHKSAPVDEVITAVRRIHAGEQLLTFEQVYEALRLVNRDDSSESLEHRPLEPLTSREIEVLQALADGLSDREIAERYHVSVATVRTHLTNILAKLDARSRLQALVHAVRQGIVSID